MVQIEGVEYRAQLLFAGRPLQRCHGLGSSCGICGRRCCCSLCRFFLPAAACLGGAEELLHAVVEGLALLGQRLGKVVTKLGLADGARAVLVQLLHQAAVHLARPRSARLTHPPPLRAELEKLVLCDGPAVVQVEDGEDLAEALRAVQPVHRRRRLGRLGLRCARRRVRRLLRCCRGRRLALAPVAHLGRAQELLDGGVKGLALLGQRRVKGAQELEPGHVAAAVCVEREQQRVILLLRPLAALLAQLAPRPAEL